MNALIKKVFPISLILLLNACAHYSRPYYPDSASYGGGYMVVQRSYYQGAPDYGYYSPGNNHFHDAYRPRWNADHGRPPHPQLNNHYHPDRNKLKNPSQWGNPRWEHKNGRPRKEDRGMPDHSQQRFREHNHQGNERRRDYTAPVGGRSDQRQFGSRKNENRNPRREEHGMPNRARQQRPGDGNRQRYENQRNNQRTRDPVQERRPNTSRGNPHGRPDQKGR